ncbi:Xaa-Pro peptidase family protein [Bradyrhizobium sp. ISRA443]|uniref:M24 family metallopeptidase n=1 Tax=unclassified Bradyrhizobium TaxID=2631580 RepID=UPI0024798C00|nr:MULTISPECIES: Xaa-Pro peptidase family protein [unclassified Bradyrhizobium]WGR93422.1 Xaa-Pro peptidase family protein [Bradyrhizobium sp. ISRA435]WGR97963.1 Xaa-Pro peptidase family protein [Bradyrhizobium sp. ISRA436]WGS04853.1 Xaa-Pro peptidase family protein [Bradyrhizobium sp. ISRA437]WGS11734.1 Xaa-Pro peptidase family protein [Bradyrhizobium sp. ISRA443]
MDYKQFIKDMTSRPVTKELAFAESEYRARIERVRKIMDQKGLDVLLLTFAPSISYLSGYQSFGAGHQSCMVLPREGEPILHMHGLEFGPAMLTSWVKDIRATRWGFPGEAAGELMGILKERGLEKKRVGVETKRPGLTIELYEGLKSALIDGTIIEASDVVAQPRMIKSPAEIEHMRKSAAITLKALAAVLPVIKPGVPDNQVAAVIYQTLIHEGSEYFSTQPLVSAGQKSGISHTTFRRTPIQRGETVILEFGAAYHRYTSAICHTVAVGKPSPEVENIATVANDSLELLFQAVKPGRTADDVAREVGAKAKQVVGGRPSSSRVYGYSIGLGLPPTWGEDLYFIREGLALELKPGMTFHSISGHRVPGKLGALFSETWVVTETGIEILTEHDRKLTVVED